MRSVASLILVVFVVGLPLVQADEPVLKYPLIARYGGIVAIDGAAHPPRKGAKVVFDITAESEPEEVNRGLESVARYLNLNAQAGHRADDVQLALVLHGEATRCALGDQAYARHAGRDRNPNLPLLRELKKHGVEVFVCGQSLAKKKFSFDETAQEAAIAVSAMTVNVNKQAEGYASLAVH